jgi:hypothetical protein
VPFTGEIAVPAERRPAHDRPGTAPCLPGGEPRSLVPVVTARPARLMPVPAPLPVPSRPICPMGGCWPVWSITPAMRLIVSDEGGDVRIGIERYSFRHVRTAAT